MYIDKMKTNFTKISESFLEKKAISYSTLQPTNTALKKSIIDCVFSVREYFKKNNFHDYALQKQGPNNKIIKDCSIITPEKTIKTKVSLYRPNTKNGDPRIWIYKLNEFCKPNDSISLIIKNNKLFLINLSQNNFNEINNDNENNEIKDFLKDSKNLDVIAEELLKKIEEISKLGFIKGKKGDKEVGELLERKLNIKPNSNKTPDYKGIEIKASHTIKTRNNLFAQVPQFNHPLSKIRKSSEIAEIYGYKQNGISVLRNTTRFSKPNAQGLYFKINYENQILIETYKNQDKPKDFAIWTFKKLHERLEEKHKKTFWVKAQKKIINNEQYFKYTKIDYTANPNTHLFFDLIEKDIITMDHLIKGKKEQGPLFKIFPNNVQKLIPKIMSKNLE